MIDRGQFLRFGLTSFAAACGGIAPAPLERHGIVHEPAALRSDLLFFWKTMLAVGPDPFRTSSRAEAEAMLHDVVRRTTRPMTTAEYAFLAGPVFAALNDGHVSIGPSDEAVPVMSFPMNCRIWKDALIVEHARSVPIGSEVLSVDGVPASRIVAAALAITGGQTRALHESIATASLYFVLTTLVKGGLFRAYRITWRTPAGTVVTEDLRSSRGGHAPPQPPPYTFALHDDDRIGVIRYDECRDAAAMATFLDASFARMRAVGARTLVVDLRANRGGDSRVSDVLLARIAKVPFRQYGGTTVRSSALLKAYYGRAEYVERYSEDAWRAPDGRVLSTTTGDLDLIRPDRSSKRFDGDTYVLIGPATFSSGMSCAAAVKAYGLATLVGEETGEPMNATGEIFYVQAPRTRMTGVFTTKVTLAPEPAPNGRGVRPDVTIPTGVGDFAAHRDPQLAWIAHHVAATA